MELDKTDRGKEEKTRVTSSRRSKLYVGPRQGRILHYELRTAGTVRVLKTERQGGKDDDQIAVPARAQILGCLFGNFWETANCNNC